ncbi:tRNA (adenine-N(1)-)-methyltransferase catalytic subunit trm61 [Xylographa opegraphella]|nr:tRNA (adenine-N(1)-)-methyltransferase catalytic subunit trm61 [Xylographa opegraphella]
MTKVSPFLSPGPITVTNNLAVLHLKRDLQVPVVLRSSDDKNEGYSEGKVTNTRFGSFPHSTLIGVPWGSQVRASAVDTGSRGRKPKNPPQDINQGQKRKRDATTTEKAETDAQTNEEKLALKAAVTASTGFAHLLPPTPETWTTSLPHRTQVVYTPDYSYILQRLRVRPGSVVIEAGAGSGSFTHAAARAVYNGSPDGARQASDQASQSKSGKRIGKVWSFEFHEQRVEKLTEEIRDHGLDDVVEIAHRDVCTDGFSVFKEGVQKVKAEAIFLDLPAPWIALQHLTRASRSQPPIEPLEFESLGTTEASAEKVPDLGPSKPEMIDERLLDISTLDIPPNPDVAPVPSPQKTSSPLSPLSPIRICTFSPCIEQVQSTIRALRSLSYTSIETVEIAAKRIEVRRERVGLIEEGQRGVNASPASVDEAITRLLEIESRTKAFHKGDDPIATAETTVNEADEPAQAADSTSEPKLRTSKQHRLAAMESFQASRKLYKEGRLVHRPEPELKTHTSYLTFAILPREWSAEDEAKAQAKWCAGTERDEEVGGRGMSRRREKKARKAAEGGGKGFFGDSDIQDGGAKH